MRALLNQFEANISLQREYSLERPNLNEGYSQNSLFPNDMQGSTSTLQDPSKQQKPSIRINVEKNQIIHSKNIMMFEQRNGHVPMLSI